MSSLVGTRRYLALKTLLVYLHYPFLVLADSRATYEGISIHLLLQSAAQHDLLNAAVGMLELAQQRQTVLLLHV